MRVRPTNWARRTVNTVGQVIILPEPYYRKITLLAPESDSIEIGLYSDEAELLSVIGSDDPEGPYPGNIDLLTQDAQLPLLPVDVFVHFEVCPGQAAIGRCRDGVGELSVLVEYLKEA